MDAEYFSPSRSRQRLSTRRAAFSLVEVTIAIGIVAVAILPLVGLLSVGLNSYQNANQRGAAAQAVSLIASCLRSATADVDTSAGKLTGTYTAASPLHATNNTAIQWTFDGTTASYPLFFDENGNLASFPTPAGAPRTQLAAMLVLTAPKRATGVFTPGTAQIVVAWPALGTSTYSNGKISFTNPQGHEEATVVFGSTSP